MKISTDTGMSIVTEMKKIIHEDLTFMDTNGQIIACTDPKRIGDFHAASRKMLDEGLKELTVLDEDTYAGTRPGINLALEIRGQTVGIVGITGREDAVSRYGQVVKKMTEILLLENDLKEQKLRERRAKNRFLQEWLATNELRMNSALAREALAQGVDMSVPRRVAVLEPAPGQTMSQEKIELIEHRIRSVLKEDMRNLSGSSGGSLVVLITEREDAAVLRLIHQIQQLGKRECGCRLLAGVDSEAVCNGQVRSGYLRAQKALGGATSGEQDVALYNNILLEIFINDVPRSSKVEFVRRVFRNCPESKLQEEVHILRVLYQCNGSITEAAKQLFLHKNTLQYRLNRLAERTGYDPRKLGEAAYFYLAITFYEDLHQE